MNITKYRDINEDIVRELDALHKRCCDFDGVSHPFYVCDDETDMCARPVAYICTDDICGSMDDENRSITNNPSTDDRISAALTVYYIEETECEIYALTHPECRRRGHFGALFAEFLKDAERIGMEHISMPVAHDNPFAQHIMRADKRIRFSHSEYILKYGCAKAKQNTPDEIDFSNVGSTVADEADFINASKNKENLDTPASINLSHNHGTDIRVTHENENTVSLKFLSGGTLIGGCKVDFSSGCATIFGYEIIEKYRGRGYGNLFLPSVTDYILKREKNILLHVSGANTPALRMYTRHGFKIYSCIDILAYLPKR